MGRRGLLALCVIGLIAGVAWALADHQSVWVIIGIVVLMLALVAAAVQATTESEGD